MFRKKVFEYKGREIRKGEDLSGADLSGLVGRDVLAALGSLKGLNFANADLTGANFDGLELQKVNFAGANRTGASFEECWFPRWDSAEPDGFIGATLTKATITTAGEWTLGYRAANRPKWWSPNFPTRFTEAILDGATFRGNFHAFEFTNARLRGARFSKGTVFNSSVFIGADFSGSHFEGDQDFKFSGPHSVHDRNFTWHDFGNSPCFFVAGNLQGAKFLDVTGCAYFQHLGPSLPEITVADGIFYLPLDYNFDELRYHKIFEFKSDTWTFEYVALTPHGVIRKSSSGVESKLAEARQLLDDGLIDQAEHDALRRKILGLWSAQTS